MKKLSSEVLYLISNFPGFLFLNINTFGPILEESPFIRLLLIEILDPFSDKNLLLEPDINES